MSIEFQCNACGATLRVPQSAAGQGAQCGDCYAVVPVPRASSLSAPLPSAAQVIEAELADDPRNAERLPQFNRRTSAVGANARQLPFIAGELASLWRRFFGGVLDSFFILLGVLPGLVLALDARFGDGAPRRGVAAELFDGTPEMRAMVAGFLAVSVVNWVLIVLCGRSLGKLIVGTRIVLRDGSLPGFVHGVVLRHWVMLLLGLTPYIGKPLQMYDITQIFGEERRCLHDRIAGTWVVRA